VNTEGKRPLARDARIRDVRIVSTGSYVPKKILTNQDLERMVDTSDEWIVTRTGIKERHIIEPGQAASDLAEPAGRLALERAGVSPGELDAILVATVTGDHWFPSTACLLQARLGATKAFCMDVMAGCSGFLYACQTGRALIAAGQAETILVIGVEILTKITDWTDRNTCVLFGDAAGAAVLRPGDENHRFLALRLGADGTNSSLIDLPGGGTRMPLTAELLEQGMQYIRMKGNEVFKLGVRSMEEVARAVLEEAGVRAEEVALCIPHQANLRIIDALAKRLDLPEEKVFCNIHKYGNTSSASVPLALDEAVKEGRVREGDLVLMVVFGAGLTWGAGLVRW
jgi:3-oxoacyl-[acyl-carrier-protein] synthase III